MLAFRPSPVEFVIALIVYGSVLVYLSDSRRHRRQEWILFVGVLVGFMIGISTLDPGEPLGLALSRHIPWTLLVAQLMSISLAIFSPEKEQDQSWTLTNAWRLRAARVRKPSFQIPPHKDDQAYDAESERKDLKSWGAL